jgi:hypothetical protein
MSSAEIASTTPGAPLDFHVALERTADAGDDDFGAWLVADLGIGRACAFGRRLLRHRRHGDRERDGARRPAQQEPRID